MATDRQSPDSWNHLYLERHQDRTYQGAKLWLTTWLPLIKTSQPNLILELGCGSGIDTEYLAEQGYPVIAADYAQEGLKITRRFVPTANTVQLNLAHPLPFRPNTFSMIIASLSLHYFSWARTKALAKEIRACLKPEGLLLTRLNSINDVNYGSRGGEQLEPGYFLVRGRKKRFFTEANIRQLFPATQWQNIRISETQTYRFGKPKIVWEGIFRRD